jgi:hypothetical protein
MRRAQELASGICGLRGAVPQGTDLYRSMLRRWAQE